MMRPLRSLAAVAFALLLFAPGSGRAQTLGNGSVVLERKALGPVDPLVAPKLLGTAFEFRTGAAHKVLRAQVLVDSIVDCANTPNLPRSYRLGIQTADAGKPSGTWVGTPLLLDFASVTPPAWTNFGNFGTPPELAADTVYFLVLENDPATRASPLDCEPALVYTSPEIDRVPATQAPSRRAVWTQAASNGAWSEVQGAEPVFFLVYDDADPLPGPSCAAGKGAEGNPYSAFATERADATAYVEQTFGADRRWEVTSVEVPLVNVVGSPTLELVEDASGAVRGSAVLAPTAAANVYRAAFAQPLSLEPGLYSVRVKGGPAASADWVTAAVEGRDFTLCDPQARVGFGGGRGFLSRVPVGGAAAATLLPKEDALFSVQGCPLETWFVDSDGDGHGRSDLSLVACAGPAGYVARSGDCDDAAALRYPGAEEVCDGLDNDCDAAVDDLEPAARPPCPLQQGVCAGALQACREGAWQGCGSAEYGADWEAVEDRCDGKDNDCNGAADDFPVDGMPLCANQRGVCAGMRGVCSAGTSEGCDPTPLPGYQALETLCDGLDNDCDGVVDPPSRCLSGQFGPEETYELGGCGCAAGGAALPAAVLPLVALGLRLRRRRSGG